MLCAWVWSHGLGMMIYSPLLLVVAGVILIILLFHLLLFPGYLHCWSCVGWYTLHTLSLLLWLYVSGFHTPSFGPIVLAGLASGCMMVFNWSCYLLFFIYIPGSDHDKCLSCVCFLKASQYCVRHVSSRLWYAWAMLLPLFAKNKPWYVVLWGFSISKFPVISVVLSLWFFSLVSCSLPWS